VAQARAKHGTERVTFEIGDAQKMRFQDATFDRTLSMLVLNFIPDAGKAVSEMKRVTRKGGTLAAAVWDYGEGMEMLRVFWDEAVAGDPAAERKHERHMKYCGRGQLSALWREQGLTGIVDDALTIPTHFVSFDDYWSPFLEKQGPAGAYVATLSAAAREALRDRLRRRLVGEGSDKGFTLHARAWAARGVVQ
jgi:SAM-dependent methyltransferase